MHVGIDDIRDANATVLLPSSVESNTVYTKVIPVINCLCLFFRTLTRLFNHVKSFATFGEHCN